MIHGMGGCRRYCAPAAAAQTMDHFYLIYSQRAGEYHRMIRAEDVEGNLLPAIERVAPLAGRRLLDLGTGSGRIPLLAHGRAASITGLDLHRAMLAENQRQRQAAGGNWDLVQGDIRCLPFPDGWVDVVTAGWVLGHLRGWYAADWRSQIGQALAEMQRVVRPGGALLILETMTTGSLTPAPPSPELAEYYTWLEADFGFQRQVIRTDYQFASVEEAAEHTEFFFGAGLAGRIREQGWARLPEWTGVWGKVIPAG